MTVNTLTFNIIAHNCVHNKTVTFMLLTSGLDIQWNWLTRALNVEQQYHGSTHAYAHSGPSALWRYLSPQSFLGSTGAHCFFSSCSESNTSESQDENNDEILNNIRVLQNFALSIKFVVHRNNRYLAIQKPSRWFESSVLVSKSSWLRLNTVSRITKCL